MFVSVRVWFPVGAEALLLVSFGICLDYSIAQMRFRFCVNYLGFLNFDNQSQNGFASDCFCSYFA